MPRTLHKIKEEESPFDFLKYRGKKLLCSLIWKKKKKKAISVRAEKHKKAFLGLCSSSLSQYFSLSQDISNSKLLFIPPEVAADLHFSLQSMCFNSDQQVIKTMVSQKCQEVFARGTYFWYELLNSLNMLSCNRKNTPLLAIIIQIRLDHLFTGQ